MRFPIFSLIVFMLPFHSDAFEILAAKRLDSSIFTSFNQKVLVESYQRIGIDAKMLYIPEAEINQRVRKGDYDALASKISDEDIINQGIKIDPPLLEQYIVHLFTLKERNLGSTKLKVGAIKGNLGHQKAVIKNRLKFKKVIYATDYNGQFKMLKRKRVDVIMLTDIEYLLQLTRLQAFQIEVVERDIFKTQINHYLHKKHESVAEKLSRELQKLKASKKLDFSNFMAELLGL